jgi:RHS repeat-associated protein
MKFKRRFNMAKRYLLFLVVFFSISFCKAQNAYIWGNQTVVPGSTETYSVYFDWPTNDVSYDVYGGTIVSYDPSSVTVQWDNTTGSGSISVWDYTHWQTTYIDVERIEPIPIPYITPYQQYISYGVAPQPIEVLWTYPPSTTNISYQWYKGNGQIINGAASSSYLPPNPDANTVSYYCIVNIDGNLITTSTSTIYIPQFSSGFISLPSQLIYNQHPAIGVTSPGGGLCSTYTYEWEVSYNGILWEVIGTLETFPTSFILKDQCYIRRKVTCSNQVLYSNTLNVKPNYTTVDYENKNYVRETEINIKGITSWYQADQLSTNDKTVKTTFYDGQGRVMQEVLKEMSFNEQGTWNDLVSVFEYDLTGKTEKKYLAYSTADTKGKFKDNAVQKQADYYSSKFNETHPYEKLEYNNSPLNIITKEYEAGGVLAGSNVNSSIGFEFNGETDNVRIWKIGYGQNSVPLSSGSYASNSLFKSVMVDEEGNKTIEYKNYSGQVVLSKIQSVAESALTDHHTGWACTYYVYDDFNRLRFIITPKAVEWLSNNGWNFQNNLTVIDELCFWNEYDKRGRFIRRKSPGGAVAETVYDARDRVVYQQTGNLRDANQWLLNLYDSQDRVVATGLVSGTGKTRSILQAEVDQINFLNSPISLSVVINNGVQHTLLVKGAPISNAQGVYALSINYYDHYNYPGVKTFNSQINFNNTVETNKMIEFSQSFSTLGLLTGSLTRVLDNGDKFLTKTTFYDIDGNAIQTHTETIKNTTDVTSVQFDYSGDVRSTHSVHTSNFGSLVIVEKNSLDKLGRVLEVKQSLNGSPDKSIVKYQYNELGSVKKTVLSPSFNNGSGIETLNYEYNLRGTLTSMNKVHVNDYLRNGNYFGYELVYERATNDVSTIRKDGKISAIKWKSFGDNRQRLFQYNYDNRGQLLNSTFYQKNYGSTSWANDKMNFSSSFTYKDLNGNLGTLVRMGVVPGEGIKTIDNLEYTYDNNYELSNRLIKVKDNVVGSYDGKLFDFKDGNTSGNDYEYNAAGQLAKDKNKGVGTSQNGIEYNVLGMPISVKLDNTNKIISYVYDASGNKLSKRITEPAGASNNNQAIDVLTEYVNGFIYEKGLLAFWQHTEGRVRIISPYVNGNNHLNGGVSVFSGKEAIYDYYIKDHLSSVRVILTEEKQQNSSIATMETDNTSVAQTEQNIFGQEGTDNEVVQTRKDKPGDWNSNTSGKVSRLSGIGSDKKVGPNVFMRVMAGDKVYGMVNYFYQQTESNQPQSQLTSLLVNTLMSGIVSSAAPNLIKSSTTSVSNSLNNSGGDLASFFQQQNSSGNNNRPRAFLTILYFDEQFNFVSEGSYSERVVSAGDNAAPLIIDSDVPQNGYAIMYISNESEQQYVYFDNFQVTHTRGRLIEENHYYAYGLKIAGISSKALPGKLGGSKVEANVAFGFQGSFSEENYDLVWNEFFLRNYDPQLGRWLSLDPYDEYSSGYIGMGNDPVNNVDEDGGSTSPPGVLARAFSFAKQVSGQVSVVLSNQVFVGYLEDGVGWVTKYMGKFDPALEFMANFGSFTISTAVTIGNRPYQPPVDSYVQRPVLQNLNYNYNVKATTVSQSENLTLSSFEKSRKATNRIIQNEAGGFNPDGSPGFRQAMAQYKKTDAVFKAIDRFENGPAPVILSFTPIGRVGGIAGAGRSLLIEDGIAIFTSSRSMAASRTYTIFDGSGKLYKFGVTDAKLARYGQSLKQAGPGSYGRYSSIMPKFEAHISEKYLRSLHFSSTGQYALPGMRVPFPLDFSTGLPIKK